MDVPLFSILVPTYNRRQLVQRAIESVFVTRGEASFELLVVDDGSSDGTAEALQEYQQEPEFRWLPHPHNRGLAHARNTGFDAAKGKWTILLDSDNKLLPGTLSRLAELDRTVAPSVGIIWGNSVDPKGQTLVRHGQFGTFDGKDILRQKITGGEHFSVVRTALAKRFPYRAVCRRHACEPLFWYTLGLHTEVHIVPEVLGYYETAGDDRFCSIEHRLAGAGDLAQCYRACIEQLEREFLELAPAVYWDLAAKVAFYESVDGRWARSLYSASKSLRGVRFVPRNLAVFGVVLMGPPMARRALRYLNR